MPTSYTLSDTLPKDDAGAKLMGWINSASTASDFTLPKGVNAKGHGPASLLISHLAVATHTVGSALEGVGVAMMGAYTESPSAIGAGGAQLVRVDKLGSLYVRAASVVPQFTSASAETFTTGSCLLFDIDITMSDVNAGDSVTIGDGDSARYTFTAESAGSPAFRRSFNAGQYFANGVKMTRSVSPAAAATSVTVGYSQN